MANDFNPMFSADGRWLYFFSNRDGGRGGDDLYRAPVLADGSFGPVANLGPGVNSAGNEWAPTPSRDGRHLLFSSDGLGGAEAIKKLTTCGSIDLLLTDLIMPEMLGTELVDRLQVARPELKVILMSGYSHALVAHETIADAPRTGFIEKPFSADGLQQVVRDLLDAT